MGGKASHCDRDDGTPLTLIFCFHYSLLSTPSAHTVRFTNSGSTATTSRGARLLRLSGPWRSILSPVSYHRHWQLRWGDKLRDTISGPCWIISSRAFCSVHGLRALEELSAVIASHLIAMCFARTRASDQMHLDATGLMPGQSGLNSIHRVYLETRCWAHCCAPGLAWLIGLEPWSVWSLVQNELGAYRACSRHLVSMLVPNRLPSPSLARLGRGPHDEIGRHGPHSPTFASPL